MAAIHFILSNSAKYDVDEVTLSKELQQLGICVYYYYKDSLVVLALKC